MARQAHLELVDVDPPLAEVHAGDPHAWVPARLLGRAADPAPEYLCGQVPQPRRGDVTQTHRAVGQRARLDDGDLTSSRHHSATGSAPASSNRFTHRRSIGPARRGIAVVSISVRPLASHARWPVPTRYCLMCTHRNAIVEAARRRGSPGNARTTLARPSSLGTDCKSVTNNASWRASHEVGSTLLSVHQSHHQARESARPSTPTRPRGLPRFEPRTRGSLTCATRRRLPLQAPGIAPCAYVCDPLRRGVRRAPDHTSTTGTERLALRSLFNV